MRKLNFLAVGLIISLSAFGQTFETPQIDDNGFDHVQAKVGADFAMQYQMLEDHADSALVPLGKGLNLPTANFTISADLARGVRVHLTTYLSSRHHNEAWVKGGYLILDQLPFIHSDAIDKAMNYLTLKVGVMEMNYGDEHFRRSDNGNVINNPFVGNYIMDGFTTAPALELTFRNPSGIIAMGGLSTADLKPALVGFSASSGYTTYNLAKELGVYGKIGIDKQINDDLRIRATVSAFHNNQSHSITLYNGDRTGSRFFLVMKPVTNTAADVDPSVNHTTGRWGPGTAGKDNSVMLNLFTRYYGLEFFGTIEQAKGASTKGTDFKFNQYAAEALYHFGGDAQFYGGARYDYVKNDVDMNVNRYEIAAGWDMTKNIVAKVEYVNQTYTNFNTLYGTDAGFKGVMVEAGISF